eukprot:2956908-Pleurochrysis_carterae.AAC.1
MCVRACASARVRARGCACSPMRTERTRVRARVCVRQCAHPWARTCAVCCVLCRECRAHPVADDALLELEVETTGSVAANESVVS